jgi:two-component system OmpR family sensor kinase
MAFAFLALAIALMLASALPVYRALRSHLVDLHAVRLRAQAKPVIDRRIEHLSDQISIVELAAILAMDLTNRETTACVVDSAGRVIASGPPDEGPPSPLLPDEQYQKALAGDPHVTCLVRIGGRDVLAVLVPPLAWLPRPPAVIQLSTDLTANERLLRRAVGIVLTGVLCVAGLEFALDVGVGGGLGVVALVAIAPVMVLAARVIRPSEIPTEVGRSLPVARETAAREDFTAVMRRVEAAFLAKQASEEQMRRFIADASHELRTPLTSLGAAADVLLHRAKDDPERTEQLARVIRSQADRLGRLVEDLLTLARLDSGIELVVHDVQLDRLVVQHGEQLALALPDREVRLGVVEPAPVRGNEERLKQLLENLTTNAVRHTAPGGCIELGVALNGRSAVLTVRDDGAGIAESELPYVFERFFRGDPARGAGGYGLGLAIVREITEAHGGSVGVSSRLGEGAVFTVTLPLARPIERLPRAEPPP